MGQVKVKDFLEKWIGNYIIVDEHDAVYGEGGQDGNSLTEAILNQDIIDIRLDKNMWTENSGDIILTIKGNQ